MLNLISICFTQHPDMGVCVLPGNFPALPVTTHWFCTVRVWVMPVVLTHNTTLTLANGVLEAGDAINELSVLLQVCL